MPTPTEGDEQVNTLKNIFQYAHLVFAPIFLVSFLVATNKRVGFPLEGAVYAYAALQALFLLAFGLCYLFKRNKLLTASISTYLLLMCFSFDFIMSAVNNVFASMVIWILLQLVVIFAINKVNIKTFSLALSTAMIFLSANSLFESISYGAFYVVKGEKSDVAKNSGEEPGAGRPIYHIYLDAGAREDVLKKTYHADTIHMTQDLQDIGFRVLTQSNANYTQTLFSMSSTLNMNYFESFKDTFDVPKNGLQRAIYDSAAFQTLRTLGYKIIVFDSGYYILNLRPGADVFIDPAASASALYNSGGTELLETLLDKSVASYLKKGLTKRNFYANRHRIRALNTFTEVEKLAKRKGKYYYFIHIVSPHAPFVFDKDGSELDDPMSSSFINDCAEYTHGDPERIDNYKNMYARQTEYIYKRTAKLVETIIAESPVKPIIILQSDHGPCSNVDQTSYVSSNICERVPILNALYFPGVSFTVKDTMTPVNTYRLLFDLYFGGDYEMLPDKSYFVNLNNPLSPQYIEEDCSRMKGDDS